MEASKKIRDERLLERLERVERSNRRLKAILSIMGVLAAGSLLLGLTSGPPKIIEAEQIQLKDNQGRVRGLWSIQPNGATGIAFLSTNGKPRVTLAIQQNGAPQIELFDRQDRLRVALALFSNDFSGLSLFDRQKNPRVSLYVDPDGSPKLSLLDKEKRVRSAFGVLQDDTPYLNMHDQKKKTVASLYVGPEGDPFMDLFKDQQARLRLNVAEDGSRGLYLYGEKGIPLAKLSADASHRSAIQLFDAQGKMVFLRP